MANERTVCCYRASSWAQVISWFQIIGNSLWLIIVIFGIIAVAGVHPDDEKIHNRSAVMAAMSFVFMISFCGIFMGFLLLKGAQQKQVSFLRAWLIYAITALVATVIAVILNATGSSHPSTFGTVFFSGLFGIGINLLSIFCVYAHMRDISGGVFVA